MAVQFFKLWIHSYLKIETESCLWSSCFIWSDISFWALEMLHQLGSARGGISAAHQQQGVRRRKLISSINSLILHYYVKFLRYASTYVYETLSDQYQLLHKVSTFLTKPDHSVNFLSRVSYQHTTSKILSLAYRYQSSKIHACDIWIRLGLLVKSNFIFVRILEPFPQQRNMKG